MRPVRVGDNQSNEEDTVGGDTLGEKTNLSPLGDLIVVTVEDGRRR
jgi:hypothetical protein